MTNEVLLTLPPAISAPARVQLLQELSLACLLLSMGAIPSLHISLPYLLQWDLSPEDLLGTISKHSYELTSRILFFKMYSVS